MPCMQMKEIIAHEDASFILSVSHHVRIFQLKIGDFVVQPGRDASDHPCLDLTNPLAGDIVFLPDLLKCHGFLGHDSAIKYIGLSAGERLSEDFNLLR